MESEKRRVHVVTYGCQMNSHDSDRMVELLEPVGFEGTTDKLSADLVILNTCSVRDKADQKLFSELGRLREWREADPTRILAVGGCVAQGGQRLARALRHLDLVFGMINSLDARYGQPDLSTAWRRGDRVAQGGRV